MKFITDFANTKIVIIDNYDSFTYNLVHLIEKITNKNVTVFLNDEFELEQIQTFDKIILSPGHGLPENAGKMMQVIEEFKHTKSILGVCLGHQAIALAFGASLKNLETVYHGVATSIQLCNSNSLLFDDIEMPMLVGRYHSWVVDTENLPGELLVTAKDNKGNIMALQHKTLDITGIQFHPESIMTPNGEKLMRNWLT
ncbi:MAG: anthranilate synthase component II [Chitinophagaceae bacterium]